LMPRRRVNFKLAPRRYSLPAPIIRIIRRRNRPRVIHE